MKYALETTELLGQVLDHDDSVNNRAEGTKLSNSSAVTSKLWKETFGEEFRQPGDVEMIARFCQVNCTHYFRLHVQRTSTQWEVAICPKRHSEQNEIWPTCSG